MRYIRYMTFWTIHTEANKMIVIEADRAFVDQAGTLHLQERRWLRNFTIISFASRAWRAFHPDGGYGHDDAGSKHIKISDIQFALRKDSGRTAP